MQERVLGAIIIGGVAIVGVIWAMCEGIPQVVKAKNKESQLESLLVERVNAKVESDQKVTSLDVRRISYEIESVGTYNDRIEDYIYENLPIISLEGYNDKNEQFKVVYQGLNSNIIDFNNKLQSSGYAYEQLRYDLYQNYSLTTADLLLSIVNNDKAVFRSYSVMDGYYGRMQTPTAYTIINSVDDDKVEKVDTYDPDDTDIKATWEALEYGEVTSSSYSIVGKVTSVARIKDINNKYSLNIRFETKDVESSKQFEVFNITKFDSSVADTYKNLIKNDKDDVNQLIGKYVVAYGTLTKNADYKTVYELPMVVE